MKKLLLAFLGLGLCFSLCASATNKYQIIQNSNDAKAIIQKMDDKMQGHSSLIIMRMSIVRSSYTRTVEVKGWSLQKKYSMMLVTAPAKEKGQVMMKYKSQLWQYTPSINRLIKLPPSMMSQGFLGSDYTNDDLIKQTSVVNDYDHKIIGEEIISGKACWKIEMIPHEDSDVVWGKLQCWISKKDFVMMKGEYYDEEMYLVRTEITKELKIFDGRLLPSIIEVTPYEEPDNKTIVETLSVKFDINISTKFFTQQNMRRIR
ncbi:MAG: outer membrane lipoprotein-sorting protein [Bacteroidales bacterium]